MARLKKCIIILVILLVIISIITLIIMYKGRGKIIYGIDETGDLPVYDIKKELHKVDIRNNYYIVKNIVLRFYNEYIYACNVEKEIIDENEEQIIKQLEQESMASMYNMLDKEYVEEFGITSGNILSKLGNINSSKISITDMYVSEQNKNISIYIVYGKLIDKKNSERMEFSIMVKVDMRNNTYSIFLEDYIKQYCYNIKEGNVLQINNDNEIAKNSNNTFIYKHISDDEYISDLFSQYKEQLFYDSEWIYNKLDDKYREERFASLEEFKEYNKNNLKQNIMIRLEQYKKNRDDDLDIYVCLDQYGNSHIFKEKFVMNYTIILDNYTIDSLEFIEKYYEAEPIEKMALNIQKVFEALNNKDYRYVYNKLADSFKDNYFKTLDDFEKYVKENFYEENEVKYLYFKKESEEYNSYTIEILDKNSNNSKTLKIIMQLQSGTDFVMSFNVN